MNLGPHLQRLLVEHGDPGAAELIEWARRLDPLRSADDVVAAVDRVRRRADGVALLEPLLADAEVSEVMVTGAGRVWVERHGRIESTPLLLDREEVGVLVERILAPLGLRVDPSSPMVDARLVDGSRLNVVVPPLAVDGPAVTIRRFTDRTIELDGFGDTEVVERLRALVRARASILVVGGTGAGKTTLLAALVAAADSSERVVSVEDTAELRLRSPHLVRLEARPANADGVGAVSVDDLLRNALRMRPDRLVIGEVRGAEAFSLLLALNTGHDGCLATCHASSAAVALDRLALLASSGAPGLDPALVRHQIGTGLDAVVVVRRDGAERRVAEIADVRAGGAGPEAVTTWSR